MRKFSGAMLLAALLGSSAIAQPNMGEQAGSTNLPFNVTKVAEFNQPWRIAFLPDGRMLVTEKTGPVWLVTTQGQKTPITGVPAVLYGGQGGMLGVYISPDYATTRNVYLTYSQPNEGGSSLAMARAKLTIGNGTASLDGLQVLWRDPAGGRGGQFGAAIAFAPDGRSLYLSSGERQRMTPAQNPDSPLGKILHLTLDGKPAAGNPMAGQASAQSLPVIDPPRTTEQAKTAPVVRTFTYAASAPNQTRAETWASGFRTPYGLAFAPNGQLWEIEHGPRGGDELNLIEKGKNYGWPAVSYGINYSGDPIPNYDPAANCAAQSANNQAVCRSPNLDRSPYAKPVIYWVPVIAPGNLMFYKGNTFRGWNGSALVGGMASKSLTRITFDGNGGAKAAERWNMGNIQVRDIEEAADGSLWMVELSATGGLYHLTPK